MRYFPGERHKNYRSEAPRSRKPPTYAAPQPRRLYVAGVAPGRAMPSGPGQVRRVSPRFPAVIFVPRLAVSGSHFAASQPGRKSQRTLSYLLDSDGYSSWTLEEEPRASIVSSRIKRLGAASMPGSYKYKCGNKYKTLVGFERPSDAVFQNYSAAMHVNCYNAVLYILSFESPSHTGASDHPGVP